MPLFRRAGGRCKSLNRRGGDHHRGLKGIQREMLEATPQQEKMYILSAYPPEQRLFELEARWVANNFDPPAVINLLKDSCMAAANRPATHNLLPALLSTANL